MSVSNFLDFELLQYASNGNFLLAWLLSSYVWLQTLSKEQLVLLTLSALLLLALREHYAPQWRADPAVRRRSYRLNFETFVCNDVVLSLLMLPSLQRIAERYSGYGLLHPLPEGWLKWLLCFALLDLVFYFWHRASHRYPWLWTFHRIHHSDPDLNVTTALRFHIGELAMTALLKAVFIVVAGVSAHSVVLAEILIRLFVLLHHANIVLPGERTLALLIVGPGMHRLHHSPLRTEHDRNYALVFSFWDRLFGTYAKGVPVAIGLQGINPGNSLELLVLGFTSLPGWQRLQCITARQAFRLRKYLSDDRRQSSATSPPVRSHHADRTAPMASSAMAAAAPAQQQEVCEHLPSALGVWTASLSYSLHLCSAWNKNYFSLLTRQQLHYCELMRQMQMRSSHPYLNRQ